MRRALVLVLGFLALTPTADYAGTSPVRIGVLAFRGAEVAIRTWKPTADYLSESLPGHRFEIVPITLDDIDRAVAQRQIEFVLTNPASFASLEVTHGVARIATLEKAGPFGVYPVFGAVILARADRRDIRELSDLKGKTFMAVHPDAFGGWWMVEDVLRQAGMDPNRDLAQVRFSGFPQDDVILAVRDGLVDAGTIRSNVLEHMVEQGIVRAEDFRVLNQQEDGLLPFVHSTPLYPEWPFATLSHTPKSLTQSVASALWRMTPEDPAAAAAEIAGWTIPLDYKPVHDLMMRLRVGPYAGVSRFNLMALFDRYRNEVIFSGVLLTLLLAYGVHAVRLNRRLGATNDQLAVEIEQRNMLAKRLEHEALHDSLTGLPNRALFNDRLRQTVYSSEREGAKFAVLLLDVDRFKSINDTMGHQFGDKLLIQVASRLDTIVRRSDTLARMGGDEFVMLVPGVDEVNAITNKAQYVAECFEPPFVLDDQIVRIGASIGIAIYPDHGSTAESLLRNADVAMYHAKHRDEAFAFYDPNLGSYPSERFVLQSELHEAIENGGLELRYQPVVSIDQVRTIRLEALLRWNHPRLGMLAPATVLTLTDKSSDLLKITLLTIERAVADSRDWPLGDDVRITINIAPDVLHNPAFPAEVERILARNDGVSPGLEFEITDGQIKDVGVVSAVLRELTASGISLALDALSHRHSSIHYINVLPVQTIKIDRSLIRGVTIRRSDESMVRSAIELSHSLGLTVVAEGVEDSATLNRLRALRCDAAQGFFLSELLNAAAVSAWLQSSPWSGETGHTVELGAEN